MTQLRVWAWVSALVLCFCFSYKAQAQTITHTMGDDGSVNVPLQFGFPYYGLTFDNSWMYDNGVISFLEPGTPGSLSPWQWNSTPLVNSNGNYFIAPLWTDLYPVQGTSSYTTQGSTQFQRYNWNNLAEYYSVWDGTGLRLNSFSVELRPSGEIITNYSSINITASSVTAGTVGNLSQGEYNQIYHAPAGTQISTGTIPNWTVTTAPADPCLTNPLSSTSCEGYTQAYLEQQCSISQLNDPLCPYYQEALLEQQCSQNQLYSSLCPKYAQTLALQNQQESQQETPSQQVVANSQDQATDSSSQSSSDPTAPATNTDVGGAEITATGEIRTADPTPQSTKDSVASSKEIEPEREVARPAVNARILNIVRSATDNTLALMALSETLSAAQESAVESSKEEEMLVSGLTASGTRIVRAQEDDKVEMAEVRTDARQTSSQEAGIDTNRSQTTDTANLLTQTSVTTVKEEPRENRGPAVRNGGAVSELAGGADIAALSAPPLDFNAYINSQLKDSQFYQQREIYRGQRNVDNRSVQRMLSGSSDKLHQDMVNQQYQK